MRIYNKHIADLPYEPNGFIHKTHAVVLDEDDEDEDDPPGVPNPSWDYCNPGKPFIQPSFEKGTGESRLDELIAHLKKVRPGHIVEIVLANGPCNPSPAAWRDTLLSRGFVELTTATNSNSENDITVFHLVLKEEE